MGHDIPITSSLRSLSYKSKRAMVCQKAATGFNETEVSLTITISKLLFGNSVTLWPLGSDFASSMPSTFILWVASKIIAFVFDVVELLLRATRLPTTRAKSTASMGNGMTAHLAGAIGCKLGGWMPALTCSLPLLVSALPSISDACTPPTA